MKLGKWRPDLPPYGHDGLVTARNCYHGIAGYEPVRALADLTGALSVAWRGGTYAEGNGGNTALLAGSNSGLYAYSGSAWSSKYAAAYNSPWHFAVFGDLVICTNGGAPLKYTLSAGTAAVLGGSPPTSSMVAIVKDFVFLAGNSSAVSTVTWSSINNAEAYTAGVSESDDQLIPDGGSITGLSGGEYGLVFQDSAIHQFEYVGSPLIFTRRKVSDAVGAICHGGIGRMGNRHFFLSRRGFYFIEDGQLAPIGENSVDRTFLAAYSLSEIEASLRCTVDPERKLVIWSMPDKLWVYNVPNDAWSDVYIPGILGITNGATASITLETIAVTYPSIETVPVSFDDPMWRGGDPMLLVASTDGKLKSFGASTNLEATLQMTKQEMIKGRWAHVRNASIAGDIASGITVNIYTAPRLSDAMTQVATSTMRNNGDMPIRASGRFFQPQIVASAGATWTFIDGLNLEATPGGRL